jgi:predicted tellurium resistance membrane protein TerC
MAWIAQPEAWIALATLTALEIVLGIDNIIFISVLVSRLPAHQRQRARVLGLGLAMGTRIALLLSLTWLMGMTEPILTVLAQEVSARDLILTVGGAFLIFKATREIHESLEGPIGPTGPALARAAFGAVLVQIAIIDIVFSLDSVITAVGLVNQVPVMVIAIVLAVIVMMFAARPIGEFVDAHPTVKMLALSFLILVGVALIGEGFDLHIPKGYIYFAMAFSVAVEMLNIRLRRRAEAPVRLHRHMPDG